MRAKASTMIVTNEAIIPLNPVGYRGASESIKRCGATRFPAEYERNIPAETVVFRDIPAKFEATRLSTMI
jgi:hypothetical protein